jgi:tRNA nucleotidyltransferase (CCA-adding enzyme)
MSVFSPSKDGMKDTGMNILTMPYLGPAKLKSLELKEIGGVENCAQFTFHQLKEDIKGNNVSSLEHQHVEWTPSEQDAEESIQKKVDKVAYIASRYIDPEKLDAIQATNWKDYIKAVTALLEAHNYTQKQVYIKVLGNVWNNKPRVRFPGYKSFISTEEGILTFSAKEQKQNQEYLDALGSKPTEESEIANIEEAGF